jgi:uncharacterized protein (DUF983 family)
MGKKKGIKEIKLVRCPACNSGQTYWVMSLEVHQCRNCGNQFKKVKAEVKS